MDAAKVNQAANATVYAKDVPNTLMYQTFGIVGKRFDVVNDMEAVGSDNYGRPSTLWVKDAATDTVDNGGKYIVNPVAADTVAAAKTNDPDNPRKRARCQCGGWRFLCPCHHPRCHL